MFFRTGRSKLCDRFPYLKILFVVPKISFLSPYIFINLPLFSFFQRLTIMDLLPTISLVLPLFWFVRRLAFSFLSSQGDGTTLLVLHVYIYHFLYACLAFLLLRVFGALLSNATPSTASPAFFHFLPSCCCPP